MAPMFQNDTTSGRRSSRTCGQDVLVASLDPQSCAEGRAQDLVVTPVELQPAPDLTVSVFVLDTGESHARGEHGHLVAALAEALDSVSAQELVAPEEVRGIHVRHHQGPHRRRL